MRTAGGSFRAESRPAFPSRASPYSFGRGCQTELRSAMASADGSAHDECFQLTMKSLQCLGLRIRRRQPSNCYFPCVDEARRLREVVLDSLDLEQDASGLARQAFRSRTQFYRLFRAMIEETPFAMRRRLLLERAAWQLSRTQLSVTDIGLNADYGSLEAFTRAFRKAFGVSPSLYRRMGRRTHVSTPPTEFITIPAATKRKELVPLWICLIFSPARNPGITTVF